MLEYGHEALETKLCHDFSVVSDHVLSRSWMELVEGRKRYHMTYYQDMVCRASLGFDAATL